jgi:hypothetical protein
MQFRAVMLIALWTMFSGPVFGPPVASSRARQPAAATRTRPAAPHAPASAVHHRR